MPFQGKVNHYPAKASPGLRYGLQPISHLLPTPVAQLPGVIVGNAVFYGDTENTVKNFTNAVANAGTLTSGIVFVEALQSIADGSMKISFDGVEEDITGMDFASATTLAEVAELVQTAITTAGTTGVTLIAHGNIITITSATTGASSTVSYASSSASGTDVSIILALTQATGASPVRGKAAVYADVVGIVERNLVEAIPCEHEFTNTIPAHKAVAVIKRGDVSVISVNTVIAAQKVFASVTDGSIISGNSGDIISGYTETNWLVRQSAEAGTAFVISY